MRTVICDIETDSLEATVIHCICCKDLSTGEKFTFTAPYDDGRFQDFAVDVGKWIGHNFLSFDAPVISRLTPVKIPISKIEDTLILSRMFSPSLQGGHSLEAWGERLGCHKIEFKDFTVLTDEMITYCLQDLEVCQRLREYLIPKLRGFSKQSVTLEHQVQYVLNCARNYGFYLDVDKARDIYMECKNTAQDIEARLHVIFPPKEVVKEVYTPRFNKDGTLSSASQRKIANAYKVTDNFDGTYNLYELQEFNLKSPKQVVERMEEAGWRPIKFTPSGQPQVCEENLMTLPEGAIEARTLLDWMICSSRMSVVQNWMDYYNPTDHRVHGTIIALGASTHRMAHRNPQMGNIPSGRSKYGKEMRSCWTVKPNSGKKIVGTDIASIQLCILAHMMMNDEYTQAIVAGDKSKGTDIHSVNMRILQEVMPNVTRDIAKTFIYAMLLGAGNAKLGQVIGGNATDGKNAKAKLFEKVKGFKHVELICNEAARKGYMTALDGRQIAVPSAHYALGIFLQSSEAIIMKRALLIVREKARHLNWNLLTVVHDEMQSEVDEDQAEELARIQVEAIEEAGRYYELRCPITGESKIGNNWEETH